MTMWLNVWKHNQTWEWGITHKSTSLYDRECSACLMKKISWKATFDAEWMTLTSSPASSIACCIITNSSTPPSPSPSLFPSPFHLWSHHLLPTLSPHCQARKRATSLLTLPIQTFPTWFCQRLDLLEMPSRELSYCDLSWKHLSLLLTVLYLYLSLSIPLLPPMPAHCSHFWHHHLIFPPFRQKHPEIDRKASSGDQARGFCASQSMSWC